MSFGVSLELIDGHFQFVFSARHFATIGTLLEQRYALLILSQNAFHYRRRILELQTEVKTIAKKVRQIRNKRADRQVVLDGLRLKLRNAGKEKEQAQAQTQGTEMVVSAPSEGLELVVSEHPAIRPTYLPNGESIHGGHVLAIRED